jgi:hypothetical protein
MVYLKIVIFPEIAGKISQISHLFSPRLLQPLLVLSPGTPAATERRQVQKLRRLLRAARRLCPGAMVALKKSVVSWGFNGYVMGNPWVYRLISGQNEIMGIEWIQNGDYRGLMSLIAIYCRLYNQI